MRSASVLLLVCVLGTQGHGALLNTKLGPIKGTTGVSRDGHEYLKFFGIPYAKPPVGKLRFKNPLAAEGWKEEKDCTKPPPVCTQLPIFFSKDWSKTWGQEDCLYLNVFTRELKPKKLMPVLVYIHGGGFRCGGPGGVNSADYLVDENVVFVNLQYRLSALGFLSTEDETISGNFGLKDQSLALKWIRDNIKDFGGDPNRITIFGESAGGASTNYQMIAPANKGLLNAVISESGTINEFWAFDKPGNARSKAFKLAELFDCKAKTSKDILSCLQTKDANDIIMKEKDFMFWLFNPACIFKPVIETNWKGAFITEDPHYIESDSAWMTGVTTNEGFIKTAFLENDDSAVEEFVRNIDSYLPRILLLDDIDSKVKDSMKLVREKYFPDLNDLKQIKKGLGEVVSDAFFYLAMQKALKSHKGTRFQYVMGYKGANSLMDPISGAIEFEGVSHADELLMLFNWTDMFPKVKKSDEKMSRKIVKLWADFARYKKPAEEWTPTKNTEYFYIDERSEMKEDFGKEAIEFWTNLPMYQSRQRTEL